MRKTETGEKSEGEEEDGPLPLVTCERDEREGHLRTHHISAMIPVLSGDLTCRKGGSHKRR